MRERTIMMTRIKNEERFIARCLTSVWPVAQTVIVFDDNSNDDTEMQVVAATTGMEYFDHVTDDVFSVPKGELYGPGYQWRFDTKNIGAYRGERRIIHYLRSPFGQERPTETVNEHRDKEYLWHYVKTTIPDFDTVICLDGDEALSQKAIRNFPSALVQLESVDALEVPVVYLWDSEKRIRVDGVYGQAGDGHASLRFPRIFTIKRLSPDDLFDTRFAYPGGKGGFHLGSVPQFPGGMKKSFFKYPIVHFGYIDEAIRMRKYLFYTRIDPNNQTEGGYLHIIGKPNSRAPGPLKFQDWNDR